MIERIVLPQNSEALAFRICEKVTKEEYLDVVRPAAEEAFSGDKKIPLFIEVEPGTSFEVAALFEDSFVALKFHGKISRAAFVADEAWIKNTVSVVKTVLRVDAQTFPHEQRLDAIQWVTQ